MVPWWAYALLSGVIGPGVALAAVVLWIDYFQRHDDDDDL